MRIRLTRKNSGDTLIEVLFAVAVFSLVVVGALSIMNQGTAAAQRALEITLVRQEIDAQAEALRFLNASYVDSANSAQGQQWMAIHDSIPDGKTVSAFAAGASCPVSPPVGSFFVNTKTARYVDINGGSYGQAQTYSQVRYTPTVRAEGLWIDAVRVSHIGNNQDTAGYIDFHIRACWDSPGQEAPVTLGTIVRLYEPL